MCYDENFGCKNNTYVKCVFSHTLSAMWDYIGQTSWFTIYLSSVPINEKVNLFEIEAMKMLRYSFIKFLFYVSYK